MIGISEGWVVLLEQALGISISNLYHYLLIPSWHASSPKTRIVEPFHHFAIFLNGAGKVVHFPHPFTITGFLAIIRQRLRGWWCQSGTCWVGDKHLILGLAGEFSTRPLRVRSTLLLSDPFQWKSGLLSCHAVKSFLSSWRISLPHFVVIWKIKSHCFK